MSPIPFRRAHSLSTLLTKVGLTAAALATSSTAQVTWTLVADNPAASTRSLRGLALSHTASDVFAGFIQGSTTAGARRYALVGLPPVGTAASFFNVTVPPPSGASHQAEAVVCDERGLVYVASNKDSTSGDNARIFVCDATFATTQLFALADIDFVGTAGETIGGIDYRHDGSTRQLYVTRFRSGSPAPYIERYVVGGSDVASATLTLDPTFHGIGRATIPGASGLRGIDVAADGTMFVASRDTDTVWRIPESLVGITTTTLVRPMDVALYDGRAYVTRYAGAASEVVELDATTLLATGRTFTATAAFPRGTGEGYSGIDIDSAGRLFVADQIYASNSDRILVSSPVCREDVYETVGAGCSGASLDTPNLEASSGDTPRIAMPFSVDVTGMPSGGGMYWMLFGLRVDEFNGVPLPIDLATIGVGPDCYLRTDIVLTSPQAQSGGSAVFMHNIPNNLDLVGRTFFHQALVASPGANPLGLTVSNLKRACIGS